MKGLILREMRRRGMRRVEKRNVTLALHSLYVWTGFERCLKGLFYIEVYDGAVWGLWRRKWGARRGLAVGAMAGGSDGTWALMGAKVGVWLGWCGLGRLRGLKGRNRAYLEGFEGLDCGWVWQELRLLFWVFSLIYYADILPYSNYLVILWE